jgi:hypothetical protein
VQGGMHIYKDASWEVGYRCLDVSERPAGLYMRDGTICERDAWMWDACERDAWMWDAWVWDAWVWDAWVWDAWVWDAWVWDAWVWDAWVWDAWVWDVWMCKLIWDVEIDFSVHANEGHTVALYTLPLYILPYRHTRSVVILTSCSHTGT